jgi:hypothetical protein
MVQECHTEIVDSEECLPYGVVDAAQRTWFLSCH